MVSPYLLRPLRKLDEVLSIARPRSAAGHGSMSGAPSRLPDGRQPEGLAKGTAAAFLRKHGRISKPRVVWVNDARKRERNDD